MSKHNNISILSVSFDPELHLKSFRERMRESGAVVSFTGCVRSAAKDGDVETLFLQHYPGFTEETIDTYVADAVTRWDLEGIEIIHRVGELRPTEPIVFVATASKHRRDAFEAADYLMDMLKSRAPFWKKEIRGGKSVWIEPRDQDYSDADRWKRES